MYLRCVFVPVHILHNKGHYYKFINGLVSEIKKPEGLAGFERFYDLGIILQYFLCCPLRLQVTTKANLYYLIQR